jgi:hypothetical protein
LLFTYVLFQELYIATVSRLQTLTSVLF